MGNLIKKQESPEKNYGIYQFVRDQALDAAKSIYDQISSSPLDQGHISIIVGSSCSGKSLVEILLNHLLQEKPIKNRKSILCQPFVDRSDVHEGQIFSRSGEKADAVDLRTKSDIENLFHEYDIIMIDEFQFTPYELQSFFLKELMLFVERGGIFIGAGLDYNSQGGEFIFPALLKTRADKIYHLHSLCTMCGKPADRFNQRLINGIPASFDTPDFLSPSDVVTYEPRCEDCLVIKK